MVATREMPTSIRLLCRFPSKGRSMDEPGFYRVLRQPLGSKKSADGYADTSTLGRWCRERADFTPSVIGELEDYFSQNGAGKAVRSFVSFSLFRGGEPFGVLNVHSDATGILGIDRQEKFTIFESMVTPLLLDFATMLD